MTHSQAPPRRRNVELRGHNLPPNYLSRHLLPRTTGRACALPNPARHTHSEDNVSTPEECTVEVHRPKERVRAGNAQAGLHLPQKRRHPPSWRQESSAPIRATRGLLHSHHHCALSPTPAPVSHADCPLLRLWHRSK